MTTRIVCFASVLFLLNVSIEAFSQPISSKTTPQTKVRLPEEFSAHQPTILPVLTSDGKRLYFDRKNYMGDTGGANDFDDIWFSDRLADGSWSKARNIGAPLNTLGSDVLCSLSPDDRTALVYGIYDKELPVKNEGFSLTHFENGKWQFPQAIQIRNFYNRTKKYYARLAPDNRTLLFALQRAESLGGLDLYVSFREDTSLVWSEPLHLGKTVNTSAYEGSPHLAADGKTLYFSSEGLGGSGLADLFVTRRLDDTWQHWTTPVNLGSGINTSDEDSSIDVALDGRTAYFLSSDSSGKKGLYQAILPDSLRHRGAVLLHGRVVLEKSVEKALAKLGVSTEQMPHTDSRVCLTAYSVMRDSTVSARPTLFSLAETTFDEHHYALTLPAGEVSLVQASIAGTSALPPWIGIIDTRTSLPTDERLAKREQNIVFSVQSASNLVFPSIHFAREQASLLPEYTSILSLTTLAYKMLQRQAQSSIQRFVVEVTGHTCDLGANEDNETLAEERAQAVAQFLEDMGVPHDAIIVRSEGERKPLTRSKLEEARALNRRVEVRIVMQTQPNKRAQR